MNTLCALLASGMLYCGGNDFRPVNDFGESIKAQVHVDGYYRDNGTYVQPYTRGLPDGQCWNNRGGCR